jgi:hypothetical protein
MTDPIAPVIGSVISRAAVSDVTAAVPEPHLM